MSLWLRILLIVLVSYLGYALLVTLTQRYLLYPGRSLSPLALPAGMALGAEPVWILTSFGRVEGRLAFARKEGRQPLVILFHGNGELVDHLGMEMERLVRAGYAVLLVEYPGYGQSSGRPHQASLEETAVAAYDQMVQQPEIDPRQVFAFGISLGCGPAVSLAAKRPLKALVLASPFASLRPFAHQRLLPSFLLHDSFDNAALIKQYAGATLVLHGRRDSLVPLFHGRQVAAAARNGRLVELEADHNDLRELPEFWRVLLAFLQQSRGGEA